MHVSNSLFILAAGLNFASGGADKVVIIWISDPPDGHLKYTHSDSVQCISYNPVSQQLLSCTATEVGEYEVNATISHVNSYLLCYLDNNLIDVIE